MTESALARPLCSPEIRGGSKGGTQWDGGIHFTSLGRPQGAQAAPETLPDASKRPPRRFRTPPSRPQDAPNRPHPRGPQDAPRRFQAASKTPQIAPKRPPRRSRTLPRGFQDALGCPRTAPGRPSRPRDAPGHFQDGPKTLKDQESPKRLQDASDTWAHVGAPPLSHDST